MMKIDRMIERKCHWIGAQHEHDSQQWMRHQNDGNLAKKKKKQKQKREREREKPKMKQKRLKENKRAKRDIE